ncbi:hypothetical protein LTR62_005232 [Meristemomyces frigidus]|uniref:RING-type domain-containing protein n=1 Tax=Meristemomyces frigidus TaxID=1508187 RepID=A0AAN7TDT9_9PEZI|nr:hypothetical protein LTR62_005232 [Meristemomyces frigidus]
MAAPPPHLSPISADSAFDPAQYPPAQPPMAATNHDLHAIPPFAPTPPPPGRFSMPPPPLPTELQQTARNEERDDGEDGSRSPSQTPSSEHSEGDPESCDDEPLDMRQRWTPIAEDTSVPCEDEFAYMAAKGERSASEDTYWREDTFFDVAQDEGLSMVGSGTIDWSIDRFNGTKDDPNNEQIMRSQTVRIGKLDWRIVFHPKGNGTEFMSVYVECVTMQDTEYAEFEDFKSSPFPLLRGEDHSHIKKRRSATAQVSVLMYNPEEPRTYKHSTDAHRFSKKSADYGWRYFAQVEDISVRGHGQRQALLRNDKLAFKAHICVLDDPSGSFWAHDHGDAFEDSLQTTALRPFAGQTPGLMAIVPLLHYEPFRNLVMKHAECTPVAYSLQTILWKMFSRTHSEGYKRKQDRVDTADAVSCMRIISEGFGRELKNDALLEMVGTFQPEQGAAIAANRLDTTTWPSVQEAVNNHPRITTPMLLTLELKRQEFDETKRKWRKLTQKIKVEDMITVNSEKYELFAVVTHCGALASNKHNAYVRPHIDSRWFAYEDRCVSALTRKQAIDAHEDVPPRDTEKRRDSPFGAIFDANTTKEVIYLAIYRKRSDVLHLENRESFVTWDVPDEIRRCLDFSHLKDAKLRVSSTEEISNLPSRTEQNQHELELELGVSTPEWPVADDEGDIPMSDAEPDSPILPPPTPDLTRSTTLAQLITKPSRPHKYTTTRDSLGQDWYHGTMLAEKYHGEGHLITMSGDQYTGSFSHGLPSGHGTKIYADTGNVYTGTWHAGAQHGRGRLTEASTGNVFDGSWAHGSKTGQFVLTGTVTEEDRGRCTICFDRKLSTAFYDCGHVVACKECAARVEICPVCRKRVLARLVVWGVRMVLE